MLTKSIELATTQLKEPAWAATFGAWQNGFLKISDDPEMSES